ncbi:MAG TPA: heme exporter protein CcmD [Sedimenticola sp.]|nr:heme exporter protein CcmD [Sedimenticola sp.]
MTFSSFSEFLDMGGYGLYVWGSFGVTALLMILEPILVYRRRRAVLQRVSRIVRMKEVER